MEVALIHATPLWIVILAIRKCYQSEERSDTYRNSDILGPADSVLLERIIQSGHHSVLEHVSFTFDVDGISRGCLQELARHRIMSLSVKSTRYTSGKLKHMEVPFTEYGSGSEMYLVSTGNEFVDENSLLQLEKVRIGAIQGIPNDVLKLMLPESFKTSLVMTINVRSLRNLLSLRLDKRAHWEIQQLARQLVDQIPETHRLLFNDVIVHHTTEEDTHE